MRSSTAARYCDLHPSTWRAAWPVLAARGYLRTPAGICGDRFARDDLDECFRRLQADGVELKVRKGSTAKGIKAAIVLDGEAIPVTTDRGRGA
jgi:hypothetical protein